MTDIDTSPEAVAARVGKLRKYKCFADAGLLEALAAENARLTKERDDAQRDLSVGKAAVSQLLEAEREACAKIAERESSSILLKWEHKQAEAMKVIAREIATAIRARGA